MEQPPHPPDQVAHRLLRRQGIARSRDFVAAGVARAHLSRLVAEGKLLRLSRGVYALPDYASAHESLAVVSTRAPSVVFCLLTALRYHELTTQAPFEVWLAIHKDRKPPTLEYPPLRVIRYSEASLGAGVTTVTTGQVAIRITDVEKTIADCFKFRNQVGLDVAMEALWDAVHEKRLNMDKLWQYAKVNRVSRVMQPYLDSVGLHY